jgi:hypothetical protein
MLVIPMAPHYCLYVPVCSEGAAMKRYKANIRLRASIKAQAAFRSGLLLLLLPFCIEPGQRVYAQQPVTPAALVNAPLNTAQVIDNLVLMDLDRARALHAYRVTESLQEKNRGFPGARSAQMVVNVSYQSPGTKQFTVQSAIGSKLVIARVFKKLLNAEEEVLGAEAQKHTALNRDNYDFAAAGYESTHSGSAYVLQVRPRRKARFLYRGRIWVDAKAFAVVRVQAQPAKNPSFWTRDSEIEELYKKVGEFWLPASIHSVTSVRLGGLAEMTIRYSDYVITSANAVGNVPVVTAEVTRGQRTRRQAKAQPAKD